MGFQRTKMSDYSQHIIAILEALELNAYLAKRHPKLKITQETFNEKLKQNDFAIIFYFLFGKLNPEKTKNNFRSVYPLRDSKQEAEFRQISMNMLKEINSKNPACKFVVLPILFQRLSGQQFLELVFRFANHVLSKVVERMEKAFSNSGAEKLFNEWSSAAEFQAKVMEYEANVLQYEAQVEQYSEKLNRALAQKAANREFVEQQLIKYAPYRDAKFLEKNNQYLEQQVAELSKFIENTTRQLNDSTNDSISSIGTRDKLLIAELEAVDQMAKLIKRDHEPLLNAVKVTTDLRNLFHRLQVIVERALKMISSLKEELAHVKGELFQTEPAKAALEQTKAYFKPFLETPLTLDAYSPGINQRIAEFLSSQRTY